MGTNYVLQKPYDMAETYTETSPATPMFFVLFPGVDPTPWVENLARTLDITTENGEHMDEYILCAVASLLKVSRSVKHHRGCRVKRDYPIGYCLHTVEM